ncbi:hypothetical protein W97_00787 [Coniosporium apollinis CBS 100218]|uniref:Glycosyl transferase CAP10 domain-containing protein n=1 Tax=Coniosporium apollinis (strain CBS 100218) TaxID=1168221 RepID=R7YI45_CONA1|nr:uncharacterized protein W97_00787 [Coniosporium apollinis CBS 100218]EON61572.1 hypothetical protein W97_00787 [Coniosporium apollinis CBS 100218]
MALTPLRRTGCYLTLLFLLCIVIFIVTLQVLWESSDPSAHTTTTAPRPATHLFAPNSPQSSQWSFRHPRDASNHGLSEAQCLAAFPSLYHEIDRAVAHRRSVGNITLNDVDPAWRGDGIVRAMIHHNNLYILEARGVSDHNHRPRSLATLHAIHRAIVASQEPLPDIEFTFTVHDYVELGEEEGKPGHTTWAYARLEKQETLWLMPDFNMWSWPDVGIRSYGEFQDLVLEDDEGAAEFVDKIPKLVWRGAVHGLAAEDVRGSLIEHAQGREWSDVQALDWGNKTDIDAKLLSMQQHCGYQYLAQTEGNTYSGRLKFLLNCGSVVVAHKMNFVEHFHHLLDASRGEGQNIVRFRDRDFKELEETIEYYLARPLEAQRIAENSARLFRERYLTSAAEACYWRVLFRGWAQVQGFEVEFYRPEEHGRKRKPRGVPFESYVIMETVDWEIPPKARKICEYDP